MKKTFAIFLMVMAAVLLLFTSCTHTADFAETTTDTIDTTDTTNAPELKEEIRFINLNGSTDEELLEEYRDLVKGDGLEPLNDAETAYLYEETEMVCDSYSRRGYDDGGYGRHEVVLAKVGEKECILYTTDSGQVIKFPATGIGWLHRPDGMQEEDPVYENFNQSIYLIEGELVWYQFGQEVDRVKVPGKFIGLSRGLVFRDGGNLFVVSNDGYYPGYSIPDHTPKLIAKGVKEVLALQYSWKCDFSGMLVQMEDGTVKVYVFHTRNLEDPAYEGGYTHWRW